MPYAATGKVSTSPLTSGVQITDAQYLAAIAAMTDKVNPKKVTIAGGFALVAPSTPEPVALVQAFNLPTLGTRFPVNTGLARHPSGNGWLCGDDGRAAGASGPNDAGVIWYNDNFTTVLAHWKISSIGVGSNQHSVQGLCAIPGSNQFWAVARNLGSANSTAFRCNATTGALEFQALCQNTANGIAFLPDRNQYVTCQPNGALTFWSAAGVHVPPIVSVSGVTEGDMLLYLGNNKLLLTWGASGGAGYITRFNIAGSTPVIEKTVQIPIANAIEGVVIHDGFIWLNNDGQYHAASPTINRVLQMTIGDLLD